MSYYRKKRIKSGLSKIDIASELGIDAKKYILIERGEIKMPNNLIDKFNQIVNRGINENKIIKLQREKEVTEWFKDMTTVKNGRLKIYEQMEEFNIYTFKELTPLLGYKDSSILSRYLKSENSAPYEFKNKLYTFFENELNMQPKKEMIKKNYKARYNHNMERGTKLFKWYKTINLAKYMKENNLSSEDMSQVTGISSAQINRLRKKQMVPRETTILKLKSYFDTLGNTEKVEIPTTVFTTPDNHIEVKSDEEFFNPYKERLITKYTNMLNFNTQKIEEVDRQIKSLQNELIALTKERTIFENVLKDIKEEN